MENIDLKAWKKITLNSYYGRIQYNIDEEITKKFEEEINNQIKRRIRQKNLNKLLE
jgi:lysophospholipid acyltransferase (LPLAT)-like uncharacterized protein